MTEHEEPTVGDPEAAEVDESGRNLTQQRLDEEAGETSAPADVPWEDEKPAADEVDEANSFAEG